MARSYVIQKRDTLRHVAKRLYGDARLYERLAKFNGILNPDLIQVGQRIEIPSRAQLQGNIPESALSDTGLKPPFGLEEIIETFGNIYEFIPNDGSLSPEWETEYLIRAHLPFPISLSWDLSKLVENIYCHKKLGELFPEVFVAIEREGLRDQIRTYGGCFNFRSKRNSGKLSTHSWGIAVDLNPGTNAQGIPGDMHLEVVDIFRQFGFKWGGDWSGKTKDPMHFQFCNGY